MRYSSILFFIRCYFKGLFLWCISLLLGRLSLPLLLLLWSCDTWQGMEENYYCKCIVDWRWWGWWFALKRWWLHVLGIDYVFMLQEQTIEREQERDEYQTKINKLELQLKDKERHENAKFRLNDEVGSVYDRCYMTFLLVPTLTYVFRLLVKNVDHQNSWL